jgi:hypothetical protein
MKQLSEKECMKLKTEVRNTSDKIIDDIVNEFQEDVVRMKSLERVMRGSLLDTYDECTMTEIRTLIDSAISDEINTAFKDSKWWTAWYKGYYYSGVETWHVDESWGTDVRPVIMDKLNIDTYAA